MITKTIKTLFGNLAPVHERYVNKASFHKKDLQVKYKGEKMIIAFNQLDNPIKTTIVTDKFTGEPAKLYYYNWKPLDKRQGILI
jgi:hypothetical protein|tara:strand:- start:291 stop:542 length:252 start_codon:yes stop_codon:yes gene_type:complete